MLRGKLFITVDNIVQIREVYSQEKRDEEKFHFTYRPAVLATDGDKTVFVTTFKGVAQLIMDDEYNQVEKTNITSLVLGWSS